MRQSFFSPSIALSPAHPTRHPRHQFRTTRLLAEVFDMGRERAKFSSIRKTLESESKRRSEGDENVLEIPRINTNCFFNSLSIGGEREEKKCEEEKRAETAEGNINVFVSSEFLAYFLVYFLCTLSNECTRQIAICQREE